MIINLQELGNFIRFEEARDDHGRWTSGGDSEAKAPKLTKAEKQDQKNINQVWGGKKIDMKQVSQTKGHEVKVDRDFDRNGNKVAYVSVDGKQAGHSVNVSEGKWESHPAHTPTATYTHPTPEHAANVLAQEHFLYGNKD